MIEKNLEALDKITKQLESGETKLDDSLKLFQDAIELIKVSQKTIEKAELKVTEVLGNLEEVELS